MHGGGAFDTYLPLLAFLFGDMFGNVNVSTRAYIPREQRPQDPVPREKRGAGGEGEGDGHRLQ